MKNRLAFAIIASSFLMAGPAGAQSVRDGITAWQKGDFDKAVETWRPLADTGNPDAAFNLGQAYRLGKGVPIDLAKAQSLFEQAARKGHIDAATNLGILLFQSNNRTAAMRWLRQAADGAEPRAMLLYGTALFNGDGVKPDPIRAYAYVSRAAAKGLEPARATLADLDEVMPIEQRQAGVKLAQAMLASSAPAPKVDTPPPVKETTKEAKTAPPAAPIAKPTPAPKAAAASGGGWRVQLGAFSSRGAAQTLYGKLSGRLDGAEAFYVPVGAMTRPSGWPVRVEVSRRCDVRPAQAAGVLPGSAEITHFAFGMPSIHRTAVRS